MKKRLLDELRATLGHRWIEPHHSNFQSAAKIYNGDIRRRPAGIAYPETLAETTKCIRALAESAQHYTVRSSGHNVAGRSVADDIPVVDLSRLNATFLDQSSRRVRVQGGATWSDVDAATNPANLVVPGGIVPSTGVGGLTLGGGIGWLLPSLGLSSDQLVSAHVISTDGRPYNTSVDENPALLTALRGGGHGLGVVVDFTFACSSLKSIFGGWVRFDRQLATQALRATSEILTDLSTGVMISPALINLPNGDGYCEIDIVGHGADEEVRNLVNILSAVGPTEINIGPRSYRFVQTMTDSPRRRGLPSYWRSFLTDQLTPELIDHVSAMYLSEAPADSTILIEHYHGNYHIQPPGGSVFPWRQYSINVVAIANWPCSSYDYEKERAACAEWTHRTDQLAASFTNSGGVAEYINYSTQANAAETLGSRELKIQKAKSILDPTGLLVNSSTWKL